MPYFIDPISRWLTNHAGKAKLEQGRGPILLMYHGTSLGNNPSSAYSTSARRFADHIAFFKDNDWNTATVRDLANPGTLPDRTVILTFDDGYANNFAGAFIPLTKCKMRATWFITTKVIGTCATWLGIKSSESNIMSESQIKELDDYGMEIGSHTHSHPDLCTLTYDKQLSEIKHSKNILEAILNHSISSFAYPFGRYNEKSLRAVKECGYHHACSVKTGWAGSESDPLQLRRVTIFNSDNVRTLARKLAFADNDVSWSRIGKYYWRQIRHRIRV